MNVLFILGNGFDINLGLHTGYQDFYEYYLKQPSTNPVIVKLKEIHDLGRPGNRLRVVYR